MTHEIEFKRLFADEAGWKRAQDELLREGVTRRAPVVQTNLFFDTSDGALRAAGFALRMRWADERARLTAKAPGRVTVDAGASVHRECEVGIENDLARSIEAGELSPLDVLRERADADSDWLQELERARGDAALTQVGRFENERTLFGPRTLPSGIEIAYEFDHTRFAAREDFELEVEVEAGAASEVEAHLDALFDRLDLSWTPAPTKAARLFGLRS